MDPSAGIDGMDIAWATREGGRKGLLSVRTRRRDKPAISPGRRKRGDPIPVVSSEAFASATPSSPSFLLLLLLLLLTSLILHACAPHHERNVRALATARDHVTFFPPFLPSTLSLLWVGCIIRAARAAALPPSPPTGRKGEETSGAAATALCPPPTLPAAAAAEKEEGRQDKGAKPKAGVAVAVGHRQEAAEAEAAAEEEREGRAQQRRSAAKRAVAAVPADGASSGDVRILKEPCECVLRGGWGWGK